MRNRLAFENSLTDKKVLITGHTGFTGGWGKNKIDFSVYISNPKSPFELGQSSDARKLGVGLTKFVIN